MAPARLPETMFFLDRSSAIGLQAQIRESVVSAILARQAVAGARMPSTRKLAHYLSVSRITVTLAYQELASQGYLEVTSRSGFRVAGDPPAIRLQTSSGAKTDNAIDWSSRLKPRFSIAKPIRKPLDWRRYRFPF